MFEKRRLLKLIFTLLYDVKRGFVDPEKLFL
jgi:hypothetical protein